MQSQIEYVLHSAEERGIRFIQLWFSDILGTPKSFTITPSELENALEEGMTFDGSSIEGFSRVQESDVIAKPDPETFQILHWKNEQYPTARIFCDILNLDNSPFEGSPRQVLKKSLEKARLKGFSFYAAPEIEYFYFSNKNILPPQPLDNGSYFEITSESLSSSLRQQAALSLEEMGIPVEYTQHEDAPGQQEIDLRYTDALTMADSIVTTRIIVKEIAEREGVWASFMPKPLSGIQGSGMHTHLSLFQGDANAFYDPQDEYNLSQTARFFIAGLLHHAREITAVTNQWINSYKRLIAGYEAPVYISWARNNRSSLVRVPITRSTRPDSTRIEYRSPDPACNPYLAFSLILEAGLKGIEKEYELPLETTKNLYLLDTKQMKEEKITALPPNLGEAIQIMEDSELVYEVLGEHVFEWFIKNKKNDWAQYQANVSQFELERYFPRL